MTFASDETSIVGSQPADLYTITIPTAVYRITSHSRDVTYSGNVFTADVASRGNLEIVPGQPSRELLVYLPASHPLARRYMQLGIPPASVHVLAQRLQQTSGVAQQFWSGYANSMMAEGRMATLRVPAQTEDRQQIRLPVIRASRSCQNTLYNTECAIARDLFQVVTTIATIDRRAVTIASIGGQSDGWADLGELVHVSTGERRAIVTQVGTAITINVPIPGAIGGDAIEVQAGCTKGIEVCRDKFDNVPNFAGGPYIDRSSDPWRLNGLGLRR